MLYKAGNYLKPDCTVYVGILDLFKTFHKTVGNSTSFLIPVFHKSQFVDRVTSFVLCRNHSWFIWFIYGGWCLLMRKFITRISIGARTECASRTPFALCNQRPVDHRLSEKRQRKLTNNRRLSSSADKERWRQVVNYRQQEIKLLHTSENRWAFQFESSFSPVCEGWAYASWVEREQSRTELTGRRFGTVWCIHRTQPRLSIPNNLCLTSSMLAGQSAFGSTFLRPWLRPQPRPFYFIHRRSRLRFPSSNSWTKTEGRENARTRPGDPGRRRWCLWLGS